MDGAAYTQWWYENHQRTGGYHDMCGADQPDDAELPPWQTEQRGGDLGEVDFGQYGDREDEKQ
ncbi:hypothetical protein [Catelliglobosispora koreensis]|uniref:hypothetical protein n=1 Tax=Catelliglobosispora koreensis TaxID=129052 RepID=UPI0003813119|nr:hypothetical protein [Catelliglobosispora koreensis]